MTRTPRKKAVAEAGILPRPFARGSVMLIDITDDSAYRPPSDIHETPDAVIVRMEVPGVRGGDVDVRVCGSRIEVSGEKPPDTDCEEVSYLCLERSFGAFRRAFDVSGSVDLARMTAVLKSGVLILSLPKIQERRGREHRVPIVEDPPLARLLYKECEVGSMIPVSVFQAVARVLAYVWKLRARAQGGRAAA